VLTVAELLTVQRGIYDEPRGLDRFKTYIRELTAGTDEMVLPITAQNPMGREHCAASLDRLMELGAEDLARDAAARFEAQRAPIGDYRIGLVVADDARGGWTDRDLTEIAHRFEPKAELKRGWITVHFYTGDFAGDRPSADDVRSEVLATLARRAAWLEHGPVSTLRDRMAREGAAASFAGMTEPRFDDATVHDIRAKIAPHLDTETFSDLFSCLYGDEAAERVGYPAMGLPRCAGYAVALADA